jgi:tyrosine-protein kinase Etk/Wzc
MTEHSQDQQDMDEEISLLDLMQTLVDNLGLIIKVSLGMGVLTLLFSFFMSPIYTAKVQFLPPQQQSSASLKTLDLLGAVGGAGIKNPVDQYVSFIKSDSIKDALIDRFQLMQRYETKLRVDTRKILESQTLVNAGAKDGLISLEFSDKDPKFAAEVANAYTEELQKLLGRLALTEAQQRRLFFEGQLVKVKGNLNQAERDLKSTGVSDTALKSSPASAMATVAGLKAQITAKEVQLGAMRGYLAQTAPEYRQALTELSSLKGQLQRQSEEGTAVSILDSKTANSVSQPGGNADDYISRYREFKYQETLFDLISRQYEAAKVDEAKEGAIVQVLDLAQPPERKSKPKRALMAIIATLASGFVLVFFAFVREALKKAKADAESAPKLERLTQSLSLQFAFVHQAYIWTVEQLRSNRKA